MRETSLLTSNLLHISGIIGKLQIYTIAIQLSLDFPSDEELEKFIDEHFERGLKKSEKLINRLDNVSEIKQEKILNKIKEKRFRISPSLSFPEVLRNAIILIRDINSYDQDYQKVSDHLIQAMRNFLYLSVDYDNMPDEVQNLYMSYTQEIIGKAHEAIGYFKSKLIRQKIGRDSQLTKQQQREIKEEYIIDAWVHLTKDINRKNILMSKSQNNIAQEIHNYVLPLLKDKKTATREYVLTRKVDKDGTIKYGGLSTDTIIDIMRNTKSDKFTFNPFKK